VSLISKLAVCLPLYNDEKKIAKVLDSLLSQTFKDFTIYVFDNNSTDNSLEIVKKYQKKDSRIVVFKNSINIGLASNFHRCLTIPGYEYITLKSGNDIVYPEYYERCIEILDKYKDTVLVYTNGTNASPECPIIPYDNDNIWERLESIITNFCYGNIIYGVYRRSELDKVLPFKNLQGNDHIYSFNLALIGKLRCVDEVLYERDVVSRTTSDYIRACHSSIDNSALDETPLDVKNWEILMGYIDVVDNGYVPNINKDELRDFVIYTMIKRHKKIMKIQYNNLRKYMSRLDKASYKYFDYRKLRETIEYYMSQYNAIKIHSIYKKIKAGIASIFNAENQ
jgi:glycosyltransferase involved in cell wall biosynthesis